GPRPARQVLLLREARIPHMDVEIHAAGKDERVSVIDFLVPSESLLDGGNLAVLADPEAQCLQPASEEDPSSNDPHAPPPTSGARRARAARLGRRPVTGRCGAECTVSTNSATRMRVD